MTDEKFDQILKQALTPKNKDSELEIKKGARIYHMKKITRRIVALAACAVLCFSVYFATDYSKEMSASKEELVAENISSLSERVENTFMLKVHAQELTKANSISIQIPEESPGYVLGESEIDETMYYCINLPLSCEGENIQNIKYSVNKGCFQIVHPQDKTYLVDYVEHVGNDTNFGQCGAIMDVGTDGNIQNVEKILYIDSFTLDYNMQTGEDFWVNIGNVVPDMQEAINLIWYDNSSVENQAKGKNLLLSDIEITVTVSFEDGSQSSKVIGLESKVVDVITEQGVVREAGIFVKEL